jgi:hypothetical protein
LMGKFEVMKNSEDRLGNSHDKGAILQVMLADSYPATSLRIARYNRDTMHPKGRRTNHAG